MVTLNTIILSIVTLIGAMTPILLAMINHEQGKAAVKMAALSEKVDNIHAAVVDK